MQLIMGLPVVLLLQLLKLLLQLLPQLLWCYYYACFCCLQSAA